MLIIIHPTAHALQKLKSKNISAIPWKSSKWNKESFAKWWKNRYWYDINTIAHVYAIKYRSCLMLTFDFLLRFPVKWNFIRISRHSLTLSLLNLIGNILAFSVFTLKQFKLKWSLFRKYFRWRCEMWICS